MSLPGDSPLPRPARRAKLALFVLALVALVSLPFVLFGEEYALPLLAAERGQQLGLVLIGIALLAADSVAPVPSVLVIIGVAAKAGWLAGFACGAIGLTGQVLLAAWFGRFAVGRLVPSFFPAAEVARLRLALQQRLLPTLACLRSVPVLAETSIIVAASLGVPLQRILFSTALPNVALAAIYSLAVDASPGTACVAFFATAVPSYLFWRWTARRRHLPMSWGR